MSTETVSTPAVVLGLGQNGLATVRALGRAKVPVIGVDGDVDQPTAQSRYCRRVVCPAFREGGSGLLQTLEDLGSREPDRPVLFPSGDMSLSLVSEHRDRLARYFRFRLPDRDTVRLILDKGAFQRFGESKGIPLPRTFKVTADLDIDHAARALRFPCIVKPLQPNTAWRRKFRDQKLFECERAAALIETVARLRDVHPDLLIQEIVPGPEDRLEFSLTYIDGTGKPLGMFTGRKLRQFPPKYGTACLAESEWISDVAQLTLDVLGALNYQGYGSLECKRHPADGRLRVIEVTARTWFPHGLATACGVNLPLLAYRELLGLPVSPACNFTEGVRWIHEERDARVAWSHWRRGSLSLHDWIASYRGRRTYAIAARDDPAPLLSLGRSLVGRSARALGRRILRSTQPSNGSTSGSAPLTRRQDAA